MLNLDFQATLPAHFDEYIWFDRSSAIRPLAKPKVTEGLPEVYPFGL
jgi:hypothetical protein